MHRQLNQLFSNKWHLRTLSPKSLILEQDDVILVVTSVEAVHAKAPSQYVLLQFGPVSLRAQAKHKRLGASASESEETTGQGPEPHNITVIHLGEISGHCFTCL